MCICHAATVEKLLFIIIALVTMGPPPIVTGVSPKEGPPGTRVTVRGEFLGKTSSDLSGKFCLFVFFGCPFPQKQFGFRRLCL